MKNQYSISFCKPDISEEEIQGVCEVLRSGWITTGPKTKLLEKRLAAYIDTGRTDFDNIQIGEKYNNRVVCLNSATASEELNLYLLGIKPGDEVIVPAYTYSATASAVVHCGANVKFVDIAKDGSTDNGLPEFDFDKLEEAITERTKAIVAVDLGGLVCNYDRLFELAEKKRHLFKPVKSDGSLLSELSSKIQNGIGRIAIISDSAHALGASRFVYNTGKGKTETLNKKYCGAIADFTSFSFHAVKNFTTAEGGASTWCLPQSVYDTGVSDAQIYKIYQLLSLHGQDKDALEKTKKGGWEYDIVEPWYKCNMTDIMAAIGIGQLNRYKNLLIKRERIIQKYDSKCDSLGIKHLVHHDAIMDSSDHLYLIRIKGIDEKQRNLMIEALAQKGISCNVHYKPLPMMSAYKKLGWDISDFPNAYDYYRNLISLPLHTLLTDAEVDYICDSLESVMKEFKLC